MTSGHWQNAACRLTPGTFLPMAKRLQKHLADLELAKPRFSGSETIIVEAEVVEEQTV